jgi:hypothetical protein
MTMLDHSMATSLDSLNFFIAFDHRAIQVIVCILDNPANVVCTAINTNIAARTTLEVMARLGLNQIPAPQAFCRILNDAIHNLKNRGPFRHEQYSLYRRFNVPTVPMTAAPESIRTCPTVLRQTLLQHRD